MFQEAGILAAKRATWRDDDPRPLVAKILRDHPHANSDDAFKLFWDEIADEEAMLKSAVRSYWDLAFRAWTQKERPASKPSPKYEKREQQAAVEQVKSNFKARIEREVSIALFELQMPNGKALGECTGMDCLKFGGWFALLAKNVPPLRTIAQTMTEEQLQRLWRMKSGST